MINLKEIIECKSFEKFNKIVDANKLAHAYLISSPDEEFNKQFCFAVALKLICENLQPCLICDDCKKFLAGFHPDVLVYPKNQTLLVGDSSSIIENAEIMPMLAKFKIFIINNFDKSTQQAQNKLLKTLEETPKNVVFLLNTTNDNNILQTIKSRIQSFVLEPLTFVAVQNFYAAQNVDIGEIALNLGEGWLGKTLGYSAGDAKESHSLVLSILNEMKSSKLIIKFAPTFAKKDRFLTNLSVLQELMEEILYINLNLKTNPDLAVAAQYKIPAIYEIFGLITEAKKQFKANVNPNMITDYLLFKLLEVKYLWNAKK